MSETTLTLIRTISIVLLMVSYACTIITVYTQTKTIGLMQDTIGTLLRHQAASSSDTTTSGGVRDVGECKPGMTLGPMEGCHQIFQFSIPTGNSL